jgi:hypothetical protein
MRSLSFVLRHNVGDALIPNYRDTLKSYEHQPNPKPTNSQQSNLPAEAASCSVHKQFTQAIRSCNLFCHVHLGDCIMWLDAARYYNKGRGICQECGVRACAAGRGRGGCPSTILPSIEWAIVPTALSLKGEKASEGRVSTERSTELTPRARPSPLVFPGPLLCKPYAN